MKLIIFTGPPASGKSSIAETVAKRLGLDLTSKDACKIALFERFGFTSHAEKKRLSIQGESDMHEIVKRHVEQDRDIVIDNNYKNYDDLRAIISSSNVGIAVYCICVTADYGLLARRYNERVSSGNRHQALYTLNQYPVVAGVSEFHHAIDDGDVERIESKVTEKSFGQNVLHLNTDRIESEFDMLCNRAVDFIQGDSALFCQNKKC